ncbi:alpha/beta hydrolase [Nocardioides currus]|uniref:Alpha/beta hydrolase n=2 Tax=Nocardioides currus TaxID=2133958 RepID=A0A2R7YWX4_9ACTN|nr:alpha/beta hydrolase [Nocardioides currus]
MTTTYASPESPRGIVLMLHGGKPRSRQAVGGRSASWRRSDWMARTIADRVEQRQVGLSLLRFGERGWNRGTDRVADARSALDEVRGTYGDVPVVLLGHSMGARVAVHVADHPSVVGVVGLAPWWSADDPVDTLPGRSLVAAHGRRDRITSFAETTRYVERAKGIALAVQLVDMGQLGHYMLTDVEQWNTVAVTSSIQLLDLHEHAQGS